MNTNLLISFPVTDNQKSMLMQLCKKREHISRILTISQTIPGKCRLALLSFEYQPEVYVWAMQLKSRHICTDAGITDEEMRLAVRGLNIKYSYASSNGINKSNIEIIVSWAGFINRDDPKPTVNCYVLSP